MTKNSGSVDADINYCKFCGSSNTSEIIQTVNSSSSPRTINVQVAGTGVGLSGAQSSSSQISYPTLYCNTCRKTEVKSSLKPEEAIIVIKNGNNRDTMILYLPESLLNDLSFRNANDGDMEFMLQDFGQCIPQIIAKFERSGTNPCKKGRIGFKRKIPIRGYKIIIYALVEVNMNREKCIRLVYDGGRSFCQ